MPLWGINHKPGALPRASSCRPSGLNNDMLSHEGAAWYNLGRSPRVAPPSGRHATAPALKGRYATALKGRYATALKGRYGIT